MLVLACGQLFICELGSLVSFHLPRITALPDNACFSSNNTSIRFESYLKMTAEPITISYPALLGRPETVVPQLEQALGSSEGSLGIVVIDGTFPP
jgi:hypothetical protein